MTGRHLSVPGMEVNREAIYAFTDFRSRKLSYGSDERAAQQGLMQDYGDSYYFYLAFAGGSRRRQ
jgi:hypothetical protein